MYLTVYLHSTESVFVYLVMELHAADITKIMDILKSIVEKENTVIVIEHNTDVMKLADYIIDVGPDGGTKGGKIVFKGTPNVEKAMLEHPLSKFKMQDALAFVA